MGVTYSHSATGTNDIITVDICAFVGAIPCLLVAGNSGPEPVTLSGAINLLPNAPTASNSLSIGTNLETLVVNGAITTFRAVKGVNTTLAAANFTIAFGGNIETNTGNVGATGTITTAGNATNTTGLTT